MSLFAQWLPSPFAVVDPARRVSITAYRARYHTSKGCFFLGPLYSLPVHCLFVNGLPSLRATGHASTLHTLSVLPHLFTDYHSCRESSFTVFRGKASRCILQISTPTTQRTSIRAADHSAARQKTPLPASLSAHSGPSMNRKTHPEFESLGLG